jgi:hypothetical protein
MGFITWTFSKEVTALLARERNIAIYVFRGVSHHRILVMQIAIAYVRVSTAQQAVPV